MMKILKQLLFVVTIVAGLSVGALAQKSGDDKKQPKPPPPVVTPGDRKPPPKNDKPKKPGYASLEIVFRDETIARLR